jgi:hypothetical protein
MENKERKKGLYTLSGGMFLQSTSQIIETSVTVIYRDQIPTMFTELTKRIDIPIWTLTAPDLIKDAPYEAHIWRRPIGKIVRRITDEVVASRGHPPSSPHSLLAQVIRGNSVVQMEALDRVWNEEAAAAHAAATAAAAAAPTVA